MANKDVTCKIKLYKPVVNHLTKSVSKALVQTAEEVHEDLQQSQTMPYLTGHLQGDGTFVDGADADNGAVYLVSDTPYARRLYYHPEYNFNKSENPNAGGRWLDTYLPGGQKEDFAQKVFNKLYKEEAGL